MSFILALAQSKHPFDGNVVGMVERFARRARDQHASLLVFPETLMTRFDGSIEKFRRAAQPVNGEFARAIDAIAAETSLWIAYTMNERNDTGDLPYNTAIITDSFGEQRAHYRKVHLFDAQGYRESDRLSAGNELMQPVMAPFATIGLAICYDLRFPEVALNAARSGAQILLYPAAWVSGPGKTEQWETLLRARAIENGLFVAGVSSCDEQRIGNSRVYGPDGTLIAAGEEGEELITCEIDIQEIERVRTSTPSLKHRRPDCY